MRPVRVIARANIALIKYWGKRRFRGNVPAVGSLSLTLDGLETETEITTVGASGPRFELDGREMTPPERRRIAQMIRRMGVHTAKIEFRSVNRFPTASGLASSASGGAAAVLAVDAAFALGLSPEALEREALRLSGSAPRSLYGGFVRLDPTPDGCRLRPLPMPRNWDLRVLVVCTAAGPKEVSSRDAMIESRRSPYYRAWIRSHANDLDAAEAAIGDARLDALFEVMEFSTFKMHALPMTSRPPVWYWRPATLAVIEAVRAGRAEGLTAGFTMDAGPHVKVFTTGADAPEWRRRLSAIPGVLDVLECAVGAAPTVTFLERA